MNSLGVTWQNVLNSYHTSSYNLIDEYVEKVVIPSGYDYFTWSGKIFKYIRSSGLLYDTDVYAVELD